jgi:hypothetical protein
VELDGDHLVRRVQRGKSGDVGWHHPSVFAAPQVIDATSLGGPGLGFISPEPFSQQARNKEKSSGQPELFS